MGSTVLLIIQPVFHSSFIIPHSSFLLMSIFYHEQLQRSAEVMRRLREQPVTVCGAGALGANVLERLARTGFGRLRVIYGDRVEERNLSTEPYYRSDVGAQKAKLLAHM